MFVAADKPRRPSGSSRWMMQPGNFRSDGVGRKRDVELVPFYRLHRRAYSAYWDLFTPAQWEKRAAEIAAERERVRKLEEATVGLCPAGRDAAGARLQLPRRGDRAPCANRAAPGRIGRDWFSFDMPVDSSQPQTLVVTYYSGEPARSSKFTILVDGQQLAERGREAAARAILRRGISAPRRAGQRQGKSDRPLSTPSENGKSARCSALRVIRTGEPSSPASLKVTAAARGVLREGRERDRDAAREFYKKYLDVNGIPVVAAGEVADEALSARTRL